MFKLLRSLLFAVVLVSSIAVIPYSTHAYSNYDVVLYFPLDRYPEMMPL
jgi:hypothetical protein